MRGFVVVAVIFVVAAAWPVQKIGCTQTSHLALTRAFASGTARIDRWQDTTCDKAYFQGHYYSVKAPGLAASALPAYLILGALNVRPASPTTLVWLLNLLTVVPAALLLLYLVARVADWAAPGSGVLAAVALGGATLVLPFGTLWFGHLPGAAAAFAAFALLLRGEGSERHVAAAGLLAGAAVLFEYPLGLVALALLIYTASRRGRRGAGAFLVGAALPAAALLAYNAWAFGSPSHISYRDTVAVTGNSGHDVIAPSGQGFFGLTWPSPHALAELMLSQRGLLTLSPVCLLGAVGIVALRRRAPAEAVLAGALVTVFVVYNAGLTLPFGGPFGGDSPGPRYLTAILPFLIFPIGLAARASPGATAALLGASGGSMLLATATSPAVGEGETHLWVDSARHGDFTHTVATLLGGGHGWFAVLPFLAAVIALVTLAAWRTVQASARLSVAFDAACALVAWLLVLAAASRLFHPGQVGTGLLALALAAVVAVVAALWVRGRAPASRPDPRPGAA